MGFFRIVYIPGVIHWNFLSLVELHRPNKKSIESSFRAKLDNTVWQHKGISAFLLSEIPNIPLLEETKVEGLGQFFENIKTDPGKKTDFSTDVDRAKVEEIKNDLGLMVEGSNEPISQAITSLDKKDFYVFLPAIKLNLTRIERDQEKNVLDNKKTRFGPLTLNDVNLTDILINNPEILSDLAVASKIKNLAIQNNKFADTKINNIDIAQVYFISQSGLILIISPDQSDQGTFYKTKFVRHYNFTDRAYFWEAIFNNQKNNQLSFDYASEPYVDLGGHGLVRTFSKTLIMPEKRRAVVCFDTVIGDLEKEIKTRVDALDGMYGKFTLNDSTNSISGDDSYSKVKNEFAWFETNVRVSKDKLTGRIADEGSFKKIEDSIIRFTIPLSTTVGANNSRETTLMWVRIDLNSLERRQTFLLVASITCLILSLALFGFSVYNIYENNKLLAENNNLLNSEIENFAKRLDEVMEEAETPYVRLNNLNQFEYANKSFLTFLNYPNLSVLKENKKIFRDLLGHESQLLYDTIIKTSKQGERTVKYPADLIKMDGSKVGVTIKGERIAFKEVDDEPFPHRFGIIITGTSTEAEVKPKLLRKTRSDKSKKIESFKNQLK